MSTERVWWKRPATGELLGGEPTGEYEWIWIDLERPDEEALRRIAGRFSIDEFAIEDATDPDLFTQYEDFGNFFVVALRVATPGERTAGTTPLLCFTGRDFLITVHHTNLPGLELMLETARTHLPSVEGGPDRMLGRLADVGSRRYEPLLQEIDALLLESESQALNGEPGSMRLLQPVRHQISELRSVIRPQRLVLQDLVFSDSPLIDDRARRRLTDVLERHARFEEALEVDRAAANSIIDLYRSSVAEKTNEIMKVLTVFSATLLPMSLIAGIYGMNFSNIPELDYRYGYPLTLGIMFIVGAAMWRLFRRRGFIGEAADRTDQSKVAASKLSAAASRPVRNIGSVITTNLRSPLPRKRSAHRNHP